MDKRNVPYYQVAREALIKWNGLTEEQADKIIEESSFEEIEAQVGAQNSMQYAIDAMAQFMSLNNGTKAGISGTVFGRVDAANAMVVTSGILRGYNSDIEWFDSARTENNPNRNGYDVNKLVMNMIEAVHNGWIKDNASAFFTKKKDREQQYQYLPIELIGWDEVKSDLLFIKPIIEAIDGEIDEKALKKVLNNRTMLYVTSLSSSHLPGYARADFVDIGKDIVYNAKNEKEKPYLYGLFRGQHPWTEEIREAFTDTEFVQSVIVPQLREKGFGKDDELMYRMAKTPSPEAAANYGAYGPKKFVPMFRDREWADMYGYDSVANALQFWEIDDEEEHEETISGLNEAELAEYIEITRKLIHMRENPYESELTELAKLKARLDQLKMEEKKLAETEKLIEQKENKGQSVDE